MAELYVNDVLTTLQQQAAASGPGSGTIVVVSGALFSAPTGGDVARLRIEPAVANGTFEVVIMTARVGNTMTVTRGQEGTTAGIWPIGSQVSQIVSAAAMTGLAPSASLAPVATSGVYADLSGLPPVDLLTVNYAGSLSAVRPSATTVIWENFPSQPNNMIDGDFWSSTEPQYDRAQALGPAGTIRANMDRTGAAMVPSIAPVSGTLYLSLIYLFAGDICTSLNVRIGTGGTTGITNSWGVLCDAARSVVAVSPTDVTTTAALNTKTYTFNNPYIPVTTGQHYVGIMAAATTFPVVGASNQSTAQQNIPPITAGTSGTAQTAPPIPGVVMTAITAVPNVLPYIWIT